jgi:hypothetical protein
MKTVLPTSITTVEEAKAFLTDLYDNGEMFHPEDNAHDVVWQTCTPTYKEKEQLNKLMYEVFCLAEMSDDVCFDPWRFLEALGEWDKRHEFER